MAESKYSPELIESICAAVADGKSVAAACKLNGIGKTAFYDWMQSNTDISDTLKEAKKKRDTTTEDKAEIALDRRIEGIKWTEETREYERDLETGRMKMVKKKRVTKFVPPSDAAIFFALANYNRDKWKRTDKQEQDQQEKQNSEPTKIQFED